jgi:tRNA (Thr-GGU) A37 N-methylase
MLDGTPVLDLKPYVGEFDLRQEARFGWLEQARRREVRSDGRFVDRSDEAPADDPPSSSSH